MHPPEISVSLKPLNSPADKLRTKEAAKELTSRYLAAMNGGSDTASESAAEAITEEMVAAMTYSMPLRSLCSFGGFSRAEIQEMIDKLQAIYSNPLK